MEPENGGPLEKEIPNLETIISRFQPLIFGGVLRFLNGDPFRNGLARWKINSPTQPLTSMMRKLRKTIGGLPEPGSLLNGVIDLGCPPSQ